MSIVVPKSPAPCVDHDIIVFYAEAWFLHKWQDFSP